jgi:protein TonB
LNRELEWPKYALAAVAIHAAVLAIPFGRQASQTVKQKVIDVIVMRQEKPMSTPPARIEQRVAPKPAAVKVKEQPRVVTPPMPAAKKVEEKKETPQPAGGMGNVLDEQIAAQALPGPPTGSGEGVGVAGVNVAGGKVGLGGGGTGAGSGQGPGSGPGVSPSVSKGPAAESGPVEARIGDADGPQFVYRDMPEYPAAAKRVGREGKVDLMVTIDEKGKVEKVEIVQTTDQLFAQAAVEAVRRSKFSPGKRKGLPVTMRCPYAVKFRLNR